MSKVSIIVPVYNAEKYLKKCLDSLINQTLKDIEIILVNDGSTDSSKNIINSYLTDKRVKLFNKENGGQASARNLGLKKATGDYIMFIDSDDYVELNMCEKMYEIICKGYNIVCCDYFITNGLDQYKKILGDKNSQEIAVKDYLFCGAGPCNKMYETKFLNKINFYFPEGIIYEDFAVIPGLAKDEPKVYYLNKAFLHYVHHENSTMRDQKYNPKYENIFKASQILYDNLINTPYKDELEYLLVYHLLYLGSLNFYSFNKYEQIDKIADFMKERFPKWHKNKYLIKNSKKEKLLMRLFYHKKYKLIKLGQKLKR